MSTTPDELAVWAEALKEQSTFLTQPCGVIVAKSVTSMHELCVFDQTPQEIQTWIAAQVADSNLPTEMTQDFIAKNSQLTWISSRLKDQTSLVLLTPSETREYMSAGFDGWKSFELTYPRALGIVTLSRAAFDTQGRFALVCISKQDGMLYGEQSLHVFTKINDRWQAGIITQDGTRTFTAHGSAMRVWDRNIPAAKSDEKRKKKEQNR